MPEINTAMFQRIHDQITAHPEGHDQSFFELARPVCGTTRCIGGWAVHFTAVDRGYGTLPVDEAAERYLAEGSVPPHPFMTEIEQAAAHILGLDPDVADRLFYTMVDKQAVEYVAELAAGSIPADLLTSEED